MVAAEDHGALDLADGAADQRPRVLLHRLSEAEARSAERRQARMRIVSVTHISRWSARVTFERNGRIQDKGVRIPTVMELDTDAERRKYFVYDIRKKAAEADRDIACA